MSAILECKEVSKNFGALAAVEAVSFHLEQGEILGMIGPNGAGKTTLFNNIIGVYKPSRGKILFQGKDITGLKPHRICRLGVVKTAQIVEPFRAMTVFENVLVGALHGGGMRMKEAAGKTDEVIDFVGLGGDKHKPSGAITVPGRRRLELARALATNAKVLLLDENMAGLNPNEIEEALILLRKIRDAGVSIIVVEHIMRAVMGISDRIVVLNFGAKLAEGPPREVMNNEQVIQAYLGERVSAMMSETL